MRILVSILSSLVILVCVDCLARAGNGGSNEVPPDCLKSIGQQIKRKWYPSPRWVALSVSFAVIISADGKLTDCKILKSSGNAEANRAALLAVRSATPFKSIPAALLNRDGQLSVTITFDWKHDPDSVLVRVSTPKHKPS